MKNKRNTIFILVFMTIIFLASCGSVNNTEGDSNNSQITTITWGTASLGSNAQAIATAIASVINEEAPDLKVSAQETAGAYENPRLLGAGEIDMAHINDGHDVMKAEGDFSDDEPTELWALFNMYDNATMFFVLEDSDIQSMEDLEGKTVSTGPPASGGDGIASAVLEAYDLVNKVKNSNLDYNESVDALKDRSVDAIAIHASNGIPSPALEELDQSTDYKVLPVDEKTLEKSYEKYPDYGPSTVPVDALSALDGDFETLASFSSEFANSDMSDEDAYNIVKAVFENIDELGEYHQLAGKLSAKEPLKGIPESIPVHPGAAKYYKETGVWDENYSVAER